MFVCLPWGTMLAKNLTGLMKFLYEKSPVYSVQFCHFNFTDPKYT